MARRPVTIVVIDSGIDTVKSDLSGFVKKSTGFRVNEEGYIEEDGSAKVSREHGTSVAMIIRQVCRDVEFISINILNEKLATDGRVLIRAFEQALMYRPDIIHMSLGTTRWRYKLPLKRIAKQAVKKNIIVVSAANNEGLRSYPAYLPEVVGVKAAQINDPMLFRYENKFFYAPLGAIDISGTEELCEGGRAVGSSLSAAYITGHIASIKYLENIQGCKNITRRLKDIAINQDEGVI